MCRTSPEPVLPGHLGSRARRRGHEARDLADRDRDARSRRCNAAHGARFGRPRPRRGPARWRGRRRRRARSRASGRRPRRPAAPRRARAPTGTSPRPRSTACPGASRARRRCGSAARPPSRRPAGPTPRRSAPGRPCSRRSCCAGRAARPRRPAPRPAARRRPGRGSRRTRLQVVSAAAPGGWAPWSGQVAALAVHDHRGGEHEPARPRPRASRRAARPCRGRCARRRRQVGHAHPGADQGGLVAHDVDAAQQVAPTTSASRTSSRWVPGGSAPPHRGRRAASGRRARPRRRAAVSARSIGRADEAGRAGQQDPHGIS